MLRPRIIPSLLVHSKGLVKTTKFGQPKYVGDPLNAVRIFNEKEVDEIVVFDIDATVGDSEPDYGMIRNLAAECRMPLCYGGGIRTVEQAVKIVKLGVEKIAVSAAAIADPALISRMAEFVGSQSVVVVLDVRRKGKAPGLELCTRNATAPASAEPVEFARLMEHHGAGEVVINAVDRDGLMTGYDLDLIRAFRAAVTVPMTVLGGAGSLKDIAAVFRTFGTIGAAAGSLFVFKGVYRAVLINYPSWTERQQLYAEAGAVPH